MSEEESSEEELPPPLINAVSEEDILKFLKQQYGDDEEEVSSESDESETSDSETSETSETSEEEKSQFSDEEYFEPPTQKFNEDSLGLVSTLACQVGGKEISVKNCTQQGRKLANSLIRVASTRIFSNPSQSIIELVVNSIDSYNKGQKSIGRFGMGFFSIFYWVFMNPNTELIIQSKTAEGVEEEYCHKITNINGELYDSESTIYQPIPYQSGTRITLTNFNEDQIEEFYEQLQEKLRYIMHGEIRINSSELYLPDKTIIPNRQDVEEDDSQENKKSYIRILSNKVIQKPNYKDCVYVDFVLLDKRNKEENKKLTHHICISDFAQGISKKTLYSSLLVPSSSTKGLSNSRDDAKVVENNCLYVKKDTFTQTNEFLNQVFKVFEVRHKANVFRCKIWKNEHAEATIEAVPIREESGFKWYLDENGDFYDLQMDKVLQDITDGNIINIECDDTDALSKIPCRAKIFKNLDDENTFDITVNGVSLVHFSFESSDTFTVQVNLALPSSTNVPVARNDVILSTSTFDCLYQMCKEVLHYCIEHLNITPLEQFLNAYSTTSKQPRAKALKDLLYTQIFAQDVIYVNSNTLGIKYVMNLMHRKKFVNALHSNNAAFELEVDKYFNSETIDTPDGIKPSDTFLSKNIFINRTVIWCDLGEKSIDSNTILTKYVLINSKIKEQENWINSILAQSGKLGVPRLTLFDAEDLEEENEEEKTKEENEEEKTKEENAQELEEQEEENSGELEKEEEENAEEEEPEKNEEEEENEEDELIEESWSSKKRFLRKYFILHQYCKEEIPLKEFLEYLFRINEAYENIFPVNSDCFDFGRSKKLVELLTYRKKTKDFLIKLQLYFSSVKLEEIVYGDAQNIEYSRILFSPLNILFSERDSKAFRIADKIFQFSDDNIEIWAKRDEDYHNEEIFDGKTLTFQNIIYSYFDFLVNNLPKELPSHTGYYDQINLYETTILFWNEWNILRDSGGDESEDTIYNNQIADYYLISLDLSYDQFILYSIGFIRVFSFVLTWLLLYCQQNKLEPRSLNQFLIDFILSNFSVNEIEKDLIKLENGIKTTFILTYVLPLLLTTGKDYLQVQNTKTSITPFAFSFTPTIKFSSKQLIKILFIEEINPDNFLYALPYLFYTYRNMSSDTDLQILDIAINAGTTKEFFQAVLTELVQNSLDATRKYNSLHSKKQEKLGEDGSERRGGGVQLDGGSKKKEKQIFIDVSPTFISVRDEIGIPSKGLFALLTPFLSTKNSLDSTETGEMGTGFFNLYRQPYSKCVYIETVLNNREVKIKATSIVNRNIVIDVEYEISLRNTRKENGTKITLELNSQNETTSALLFVKQFLGYGNIPMYLNGLLLKRMDEKPLIYKDEYVEVFVLDNNVYLNPSVVLSNLIPVDYLRNLDISDGGHLQTEFNVIIDLKKKSYVANQSRETVGISKSANNSIDKGLLASVMYKYCYFFDDKEKNNFLKNSSSWSDPRQLRSNIIYWNIIKGKYSYIDEEDLSFYFLFKNFLSVFCGEANIMATRIYDKRGKKYEFILEKSKYYKLFEEIFLQEFGDIAIKCMNLWFSNKRYDDHDHEQEKEQQAALLPCDKYLNAWYETTWECMKEATEKPPENPQLNQGTCESNVFENFKLNCPSILFMNVTHAEFLAQYDPETRSIQITNLPYKRAKRIGLYDKVIEFIHAAPLDTPKMFKEYFLLGEMKDEFGDNAGMPGTLIHELEHAWRHSDHESAHNAVCMNYNGTQADYDFYTAAKLVYSCAVGNKLYEKLYDKFILLKKQDSSLVSGLELGQAGSELDSESVLKAVGPETKEAAEQSGLESGLEGLGPESKEEKEVGSVVLKTTIPAIAEKSAGGSVVHSESPNKPKGNLVDFLFN